jgi:hypothetical protein
MKILRLPEQVDAVYRTILATPNTSTIRGMNINSTHHNSNTVFYIRVNGIVVGRLEKKIVSNL